MALDFTLTREQEEIRDLAHEFAEKERLDRALTHASARSGKGGNYERLEFLGDRVLGLAVADGLYNGEPASDEGRLSRRLSALVRRESCAAVAQAWEVAENT